MPARRNRVGQRRRPQKAATAAKVVELALAMEEPLNAAEEPLNAAQASVQALHLMGYGLMQLGGDDEGRATAAVAWTACGHVDSLQQIWRRLCKAAVQAHDSP